MTDHPIPATSMPITVHAQYLKDISFENPGTPHSLRPGQDSPQIDVAVNLEVQAITDDKIPAFYEVTLQLKASAKRGDKNVYLASVDYGMAVSLPQVPEKAHHAMLLIEVPKLAFPFARQALADLIQGGGFPSLLLAPIDFSTLYMTQFSGPDQKNAAVN